MPLTKRKQYDPSSITTAPPITGRHANINVMGAHEGWGDLSERMRAALHADAARGDPAARNMIAARSAELAAAERHASRKKAADLFDKMNTAIASAAYPSGMVPVPEFNSKDGFFPGASGSWEKGGKHPVRLIIVGQDFGGEDDHRDAVKNGEDRNGPTWRNLLESLSAAGIPTEDCFFTNAIVGLREQSTGKKKASITGRSPGFRNRTFVQLCGSFLAAQIAALKPRGVVLLGKDAAEVFGLIISSQRDWPGNVSIREWDRVTNLAAIKMDVGPERVKVIRLLHSSFRDPNLRHRIQPALGIHTRDDVNELEIKLLKDVYRP